MAFGRKKRSSYQPSYDVRWLIVGLGNPGRDYDGTPHNVGFEVIDSLTSELGVSLVAKYDGLFGVGAIHGCDGDVALLKPLTFMNLSGRSVQPALSKLQLGPQRLLIVHDEIDLPFGVIQIKSGGGLAGHNGLRSIVDSISTKEFVRVRVGVGRPSSDDRRPIKDWILSKWQQKPEDVNLLVSSATAAVEVTVRSGVQSAMRVVNVR